MRVCDYIADYFSAKKLTHFFGFQGGAVTPLIDSMCQKGIAYFQCYHEQASGFAADGYARIADELAVAMATNGPGATNLMTSIANAHLDSTPVLFITGQVNTTDIKSDTVRQNGFQEVDTVAMARPITKYAKTVCDVNDVAYELDKAIDIAMSGRKGAVLLDFPLNILMSEIDEKSMRHYAGESLKIKIDKSVIHSAVDIIKKAKRPLILVGGGVRLSGAEELLEQFAEATQIPTVSTLMGSDVFSSTNVGFAGLYGQTYANLALLNADMILVLGSRLAKRQVGKTFENYNKGAHVIHVDIDKTELGHVHTPDVAILGDIKQFLVLLLENKWEKSPLAWTEQIRQWTSKYAEDCYLNKGTDPVRCVSRLSESAAADTIVCTDVGQNQMWVAQGWRFKSGQRHLTSGGLGCMGFSLPAAIGAAVAEPDKPIIAFVGDGGLQMNIQELQTLSSTRMPVKLVVFNNNSLGMIQEAQFKYMGQRYDGTKKGYACPDLKKLAAAYDIPYIAFDEETSTDFLKEPYPMLIEIKLNESPTRLLTRYDRADVYEKELV